MLKPNRIACITVVAIVATGLCEPAFAQEGFEVVHSFSAKGPWVPQGALVEAGDGTFFGTTRGGGRFDWGTLFRITATGEFAVIHDFKDEEGFPAGAALVHGSDGALYGVTSRKVFRVGSDETFTLLETLPLPDIQTGQNRALRLIRGIDGMFYGLSDDGDLFQLHGDGTFADVLAHTTAGHVYYALAQGHDGQIYFTTDGFRVYRCCTALAAPMLVHEVGPLEGGGGIESLIEASDGNFYGTTSARSGEPGPYGTLFRMTADGIWTVLHTFDFGGGQTTGVIQGLDGALYGVTSGGDVFRSSLDGDFAIVVELPKDQIVLPASLIQASDGKLYGTSTDPAGGTVFTATTGGAAAVLHTFTWGPEGANPSTPLIAASDGNLWGTTEVGGLFGDGTVFKVAPSGAIDVVHTFNANGAGLPRPDGAPGISTPRTALLAGRDGNFYGTTQYPPTIFRMTPAGTVNVLHSFRTEDGWPTVALVQGPDGSLYGATSGNAFIEDGVSRKSDGSVFRLSPDGTHTVLHQFNGTTDGSSPNTLVLGADGSLYGTTKFLGYTNQAETFFKITPDGSFSVMLTFTAACVWGPADSKAPPSPICSSDTGLGPRALLQGSDGNFYVATATSLFSVVPRITKITPLGVASMVPASLGLSAPALIQGTDGIVYGTGSDLHAGTGIIFSMTTEGVVTTLHTFNDRDGIYPAGPIVQAMEGRLWGTTPYGGEFGAGEIFRLSLDIAAPLTTAVVSPAPNSAGWNTTNVSVQLTAADQDPGGSGVKQVSYSATGAQEIPLTVVAGSTATIPIAAEGVTTVSFFATDNASNVEPIRRATVSIDKTPPIVGCRATPAVLFPPNHRLVPVTTTVDVTDTLSGPDGFTLIAVTSNEPAAHDIARWAVGTPATSGLLRAERSGHSARIYGIRYQGLDLAGNAGACATEVVVPHDNRNQ